MFFIVLTQCLSYWLYFLLFYYLVWVTKANGINEIDEREFRLASLNSRLNIK